MKIIHTFRSGNSCEIHISARVVEGRYNGTRVEWERWPPTKDELREYNEEVYPQKVIPAVKAVLERNGPGYLMEVMPGVRTWISLKVPNN